MSSNSTRFSLKGSGVALHHTKQGINFDVVPEPQICFDLFFDTTLVSHPEENPDILYGVLYYISIAHKFS